MNTKKIIEYRALLGVTKTATLKELKTIYRNCMKDSHPDAISDDAERLAAEEKSKEIIAAYHFLVSIAPETLEKDKAEYTRITSSTNIADFYYEKGILPGQDEGFSQDEVEIQEADDDERTFTFLG